MVHHFLNVWSFVPRGKGKEITAMLKAVHAQDYPEAAKYQIALISEKMRKIKRQKAATIVECRDLCLPQSRLTSYISISKEKLKESLDFLAKAIRKSFKGANEKVLSPEKPVSINFSASSHKN